MKIFVNARFLTQPLSGVQRYGIECSRQIKKLVPDATFIAPHNILHKDIAKELNVRVVGVNKGHLWEQADLPFYLAKQKYPPLLNLANTAPLLYSNNFITIHDLAFYHHPEWNSKAFSAWYNILVPRLAHSCRHIFTVSRTVKDEIMKCYKIPATKMTVAYNGISHKMLSAGRPTIAKEKIILAVGTFNIRKNHQKLITAYLASPLRDTHRLVIIGDKNKVFKDAGIDENVLVNSNIEICPTLNEEELISMYHRAEIVVSLSLYEGFGLPVLEGLYNSCKVVCSDIPVYHELYNTLVYYCNPLDINNIGLVLNSVATAPFTSPNIGPMLDQYSYKRSAEVMIDQIQAKADR